MDQNFFMSETLPFNAFLSSLDICIEGVDFHGAKTAVRADGVGGGGL